MGWFFSGGGWLSGCGCGCVQAGDVSGGVRVYVGTRVHTYVYDDVTYVCTRVRTCTHARFRV